MRKNVTQAEKLTQDAVTHLRAVALRAEDRLLKHDVQNIAWNFVQRVRVIRQVGRHDNLDRIRHATHDRALVNIDVLVSTFHVLNSVQNIRNIRDYRLWKAVTRVDRVGQTQHFVR